MTRDWVNIGSGNGLLPDGTKPLPEPMLTYHQLSPLAFIRGRALSWEDLKIPNSKTRLKIPFLESHSDFPGANGLIHWPNSLSASEATLKNVGIDLVAVNKATNSGYLIWPHVLCASIINDLSSLLPEAGTYGIYKQLHLTLNCGM